MIEIKRNNSYTRRITVVDGNGNPQPLTAVTGGYYTLASSKRASDAYLQIHYSDPAFTITDPNNGVVDIDLTPAQTEALPVNVSIYEELHIIESGGIGQTVWTGEVKNTDTIATGV